MNTITCRDIVKVFGTYTALNHVSIEVPKGTIFGLLGPNGAGKTTLIRIMNQITVPNSGTVLFNEKPVVPDDVYRIGYLPEERGLYKKMKVGEQAMYLARLKGLSRQQAMTELKKWFVKFGIESWWNKKVEELSKGMAQKVQFITTVLHRPELLILDEPFSGFDPVNAQLIRDEILRMRDEGTTVILSTHNMASVEELCDNIALINKSNLVVTGGVEQIRREHGRNQVEVLYRPSDASVELAGSSVLTLAFDVEHKDIRRAVYDVAKGTPSAQILSELAGSGIDVVSYRELIPSMNDIFIQLVSIRVKKKSFIITTIVTPILFAALMIVPSLIMMADWDKDINRVMVLDDSGVVAQALESGAEIEYVIPENIDLEFAKNHLDSLGVYAVMYVSPLDTANNVTVDAYAAKQINAKVSEAIAADVNDVIERYKLQQYNIENFDRIQADLNHEVDLNTYIVGEDGQERESILGINMAISFIMGFVIYMFVTMFGNMVMTSVINEKSNKIVEVIVSSVKPFDLMIGKILGVASVALTQFFIWVILTLAIVFGFQLAMGSEMMSDPETMEQMTQMAGMGTEQITQMTQASDSEMAQVFSAIKEVNFGLIIGCFLIYFVLGYLLYASLFAAIGSAVDNEADTQQLVLPVTIPLIIGLLLMLQASDGDARPRAFRGLRPDLGTAAVHRAAACDFPDSRVLLRKGLPYRHPDARYEVLLEGYLEMA